MGEITEKDGKTGVNRFVSSLAASFRAFHLYKQNNKALDEIMDNLVFRYRDAAIEYLKIGITNRSLVFEGDSVGSPELTRYLAYSLRILGFRELIFRSPIQSRHFFQFLNIVANADAPEVKLEKLAPLIGNEDEKPICLVPLVSRSLLLRMTDEVLIQKLAPLLVPLSQGGPGIIEELKKNPPANMADFYTRVAVQVEKLDKNLRVFIRNILDAAREGFFPWERFLKVFPMPDDLKSFLFEKIANAPPPRARRSTPLGISLHPATRNPAGSSGPQWQTTLVSFSTDEIKQRHDLNIFGSQQQGVAELEMSQALLTETGINYILGLRILIRLLSLQNPISVQEKILRVAIGTWLKRTEAEDDISVLSLLSSLRQALAQPHNITLGLFPLRNLAFESETFIKLTSYFVSLGDVATPTLIQALDTEGDRSMRKKLCVILTALVREQGTDSLIKVMDTASPFLLRNIVMILGDVRSPQAIENLARMALDHAQHIVRVEAVHSLGKIGTPESIKGLVSIAEHSTHNDERKIALEQLMIRRDRSLMEPLIRMAKKEHVPSEWRSALISAIATLGGLAAKQFLESLQKGNLLSGFSTSREEQALISALLKRFQS